VPEKKRPLTAVLNAIEYINIDLHQVKPEYIIRLESIKKEGTVSSAEFEKRFGVTL
jgi:hypothetical protein